MPSAITAGGATTITVDIMNGASSADITPLEGEEPVGAPRWTGLTRP
jgi:hypothetical protein